MRRIVGERHAIVLQNSALSSFHIPAETIGHQVWTDQYPSNGQKGLHYRQLLRYERLALQWYAYHSGARLTICPEVMTINPSDPGPLAAWTRFKTLVDFLEKAPHTIELRRREYNPPGENVTIVGDWFMATSLFGTHATGYRQTIFTRHAPTIAERIKLFDREWHDTKEFPGLGNSKKKAIDYLSNEMKRLWPLIPPEIRSRISDRKPAGQSEAACAHETDERRPMDEEENWATPSEGS